MTVQRIELLDTHKAIDRGEIVVMPTSSSPGIQTMSGDVSSSSTLALDLRHAEAEYDASAL